MRRLQVFGKLLASITLILVMLSIRPRAALVGIFHVRTIVLWRNFCAHLDLR